MRRILFLTLGLFLLLDIILVLAYFKKDWFDRFSNNSIQITSEVPSMSATFSNKKYFDKKLIESGFWKGLATEKIVIKHLKIALTTTPQENGAIAESQRNPIILFSHFYRYDETTKTVNLTVQANLNAQKNESADYLYSYATLLAIFNITHSTSIYTDAENDQKLIEFMQDFFQSSLNNSFIRIKLK